MEYPKTMQAGNGQSVVVNSLEQEKALPKDYGGKAEGKSYAEIAASEKAAAEKPEGKHYPGPGEPGATHKEAQRLHDESVVGKGGPADAMENARDKNPQIVQPQGHQDKPGGQRR